MTPLLIALLLAQTPNPARKPTFILAEQLPIATVLASPPADPAKDLKEMHRVQDSRTPEQIEQAKKDDVEESIFIFSTLLGPKFTRAGLPLTALLSDHVRYDASPIVRDAKAYFHRPRPHHLDPTIHPVCKANPPDPARADFAYPSGHGSTGYLEALVLVQILPEKRDAILARADEYAQSRVICGVHYPSDMPASKLLAYSVMGLLMNQPLFRKELEAAKAETRAALGL